jgi:hypothetical protein
LRQGWGFEKLQLVEAGAAVSEETWCNRYTEVAVGIWQKLLAPGEAVARYKILRRMLELGEGDLVVIPKMPDGQHFAIARLAPNPYSFDSTPEASRPQSIGDDYRHTLAVSDVRAFPYSGSLEAAAVHRSMRAYQSAVSRVWNESFMSAVETLMAAQVAVVARDPMQLFDEARARVAPQLLDQINAMPPRYLEDIVAQVFQATGYRITQRNHYDRQGGDADLVATLNLPVLGEAADCDLNVYIQVKKKSGDRDVHDVDGVRQLVAISQGDPGSLRVLVSSARTFTPECTELARETNTMLIDGLKLADLMLRYVPSGG